ncbi:MAG TPA: MFS transporter, partial [Desulfosarcina sp.]|nr:MFS transporter [Desulfosarcina sp.]
MSQHAPSQLAAPIFGATLSRLLLNTARRFTYPFAPALSRGLGVPLTAVTSLIAINQVTCLLGALIGPLTDRIGYRKMMIAGISLMAAGMLAAACLPTYAVVLVALFLAGLGKNIFDPAVQAWAGDRVAYHRRALVIGILEISWSASTLIGIPLVAILMDHYGWQSPFLVMGGLGVVAAIALAMIIPVDNHPPAGRDAWSWSSYLRTYTGLIGDKPVLGILGYAFFVSMGNDNLFVVYGAWLERDFGLSLVALGMGTGLIGVAELAGEGFTALVADRFGLKRALVIGLSATAMSYLCLPLLGFSPAAALVGLAVLFFVFEFSMVTSLSLCTEMMPGSRATMMAGFMAAAGIGRVIGALMGGAVWQSGGIVATGWLSAGLTVTGLLCLVVGLKGRGDAG